MKNLSKLNTTDLINMYVDMTWDRTKNADEKRLTIMELLEKRTGGEYAFQKVNARIMEEMEHRGIIESANPKYIVIAIVKDEIAEKMELVIKTDHPTRVPVQLENSGYTFISGRVSPAQ